MTIESAIAVRERPILFSSPMVKALLAGPYAKTQTRRIINPRPRELRCATDCTGSRLDQAWPDPGLGAGGYLHVPCRDGAAQRVRCQHGNIGDRLWVRETWGLFDTEPKDGPARATIFYRERDGDRVEHRYQLWRPSIFMPRWASRIDLEITGIRAQRLQNISEADARAEGIEAKRVARGVDAGEYPVANYVTAYRDIWDEINGSRLGGAWEANPFVWVISFERVRP